MASWKIRDKALYQDCCGNLDIGSMEVIGNFLEGEKVRVIVRNRKGVVHETTRTVRFSSRSGDLMFSFNGYEFYLSMFEFDNSEKMVYNK